MRNELQAKGYTVSEQKRQTHPAKVLPAIKHKMDISCDKTMKFFLNIVNMKASDTSRRGIFRE